MTLLQKLKADSGNFIERYDDKMELIKLYDTLRNKQSFAEGINEAIVEANENFQNGIITEEDLTQGLERYVKLGSRNDNELFEIETQIKNFLKL